MAYVKEHPPSEVYHLTKKENLNSILEDGMIRRFSDTECWFCVDLQKMKAYMEQTVMCEGKPYHLRRLCAQQSDGGAALQIAGQPHGTQRLCQ